MTPKYDVALLRQQLAAALDERGRGEGDAFEVAALAGLLERAGDASASGLRAELAGALDEVDVTGAVDRLVGLDEDEEPTVVDSALFALDEICAAAVFLGRTDAIRDEVDLAVRTVQAFPEAYATCARLASAVLQDNPPAAHDPALALWRAVEASAVAREGEERATPTFETLIRLGLPALIPAGRIEAEARTRLAAAEIPPEPPWVRLFSGNDWEAAITTGDVGLRVVVSAPEGAAPSGSIGGTAIAFTDEPNRLWSHPARPGSWRLDLGGTAIEFEIEP